MFGKPLNKTSDFHKDITIRDIDNWFRRQANGDEGRFFKAFLENERESLILDINSERAITDKNFQADKCSQLFAIDCIWKKFMASHVK